MISGSTGPATHNEELYTLRRKLFEYEQALREKDSYLAKLELDLEHAIAQCKRMANSKPNDLSSFQIITAGWSFEYLGC